MSITSTEPTTERRTQAERERERGEQVFRYLARQSRYELPDTLVAEMPRSACVLLLLLRQAAPNPLNYGLQQDVMDIPSAQEAAEVLEARGLVTITERGTLLLTDSARKLGARREPLPARSLADLLREEDDAERPVHAVLGFRRGTTNLLIGPPIESGKSTFIRHLVAAAADGAPFLGAPFLLGDEVLVHYLTEEPIGTFRAEFRKVPLANSNRVAVTTFGDAFGRRFEEVVREVERSAAHFVVVDSLGQWGGLVGDAENSAGGVMSVMRPLQSLAQRTDAIVIAVHHTRKMAGTLVEQARGSSALAAAADAVYRLTRVEQAHQQRRLEALGRGVALDLVVELSESGYQVVEAQDATLVRRIVAAIEELGSTTYDDLAMRLGVERQHLSRPTQDLVRSGHLQRKGDGKRGSPYRFSRE